jgi:hypothetical protein
MEAGTRQPGPAGCVWRRGVGRQQQASNLSYRDKRYKKQKHGKQNKKSNSTLLKTKAFFGMRMKSIVSTTSSIETNTSSYLFQALVSLTDVEEPTTTTAPNTTTAAALATTNPDQTKPVEGKKFSTPFQYFLLFPQN